MWMREPLMRRVVRWVAWACLVVIVVAVAGGLVWSELEPFLPLLALVVMAVGLAWFAFGRRR